MGLITSYTKNKTGTDRNGALYKAKMFPLGFTCKVFEREAIGNHLLFQSSKRAGHKLLLIGHMDTVFPPGTFCDFKEDKDWVYGPGVCDMKGGNMVAIEALRKRYRH